MDKGRPGATPAVIVTPDASVLLKWVLPGDDGQDTDGALALRDKAVAGTLDLVVPQLWIYEVGNTLARRFPDDAVELLASLADFGLTEAKLGSRWRTRAVSLSVTYGVAFYDAAYHAVALGLGGVFVTADERYVGAPRKPGGSRRCGAGGANDGSSELLAPGPCRRRRLIGPDRGNRGIRPNALARAEDPS